MAVMTVNAVVGSSGTTWALPHGMNNKTTGGELAWTVPDAMVIKQVVLTPRPLQSINDQGVTIVWRLLVEDNLGVLQTRASLSYVSGASDTSPPPSNPMNPDVKQVTEKEVQELFPGFQMHMRRLTLAPPLARQLPEFLLPVLYPLLASIPLLRTHLLGLLIKPLNL